MKNQSNKVIFFGNETLATGVETTASTLRGLIDNKYDVVAVVINQNIIRSRSSNKSEVEKIAKKNNIAIFKPKKLSDIKSDLQEIKPDIGVLIAYGKIVPKEIINIFPLGILNIHPSLLPKYRGSTPIESTILNDDSTAGVSVMSLSEKTDEGPIYSQTTLKLNGNESKQELANKLLEIGTDKLLEILPKVLDKSLRPTPQDNKLATYTSQIDKSSGKIDWTRSAQQIEREIRAYLEWPKSRTKLAEGDVIITKAYSVPTMPLRGKPGDVEIVEQAGIIMVCTGNGSLCIEQLKPASKKIMTSAEFIRGYGNRIKKFS